MSTKQVVSRKEKREQMRAERQARIAAAQQRERRKRLLMGVGGAVGLAVILAITLILANRSDDAESVELPGVTAYVGAFPETIPQQTRLLGNPDAPVRLVEYADYQCPYCGDVAKSEIPFIVERYVAAGLMSFEYHNFAFLDERAGTTESHDAAEAAECAGEQGRYWDYNKTLYYNQHGENQGAYSPDRLKAMAFGIGLSEDFVTCLDSNKYEQFVKEQSQQARDAGVTGTPTFMIDGVQVQILGLSQQQIAETLDNILRERGIEPPPPYDPANYPTPTPPVALPRND